MTSRDEVDQSDTSSLLSFTTLCPSPTPTPSPSVSPSPEPSVTPSPSPEAHVGGFSPPQPPPPPPACHLQRPPGAPDLYQIRALGDTATLHFTPVGDPQDHYLILYGTAQHPWEHNTFLYTQDRSGALSVTIDDLQPGLIYFFTIRAGNGCSAGDWSNVLESAVTGKSRPALTSRVK